MASDDETSGMDQVRRLRDEIRVRIHLAGMEVKDAWKELEPKINKLEGEIEKAGDKVAAGVKDGVNKLRAKLEELRGKLT